MRSIGGTISLLIFVGVLILPANGQPRKSVRILDVQPTTTVVRLKPAWPAGGGPRITRFREEGVEVLAAALDVRWEQTPGLAPPGTLLRFEYKLEGQARIRESIVMLPPRERGPRTTRFTVPLTPETGRRVEMWRLQVRAGDHILEEVRSTTWRTPP